MRHDAYDVLVVAHAICAIVGFGAIALTGVYGLTARRRSRPGAIEEVRRYFARPPLAEAAVVLVGILGFAALGVDPHGKGLGQVWTTVGAGIWLVASGLWVAAVRPAEATIRRHLVDGAAAPPDDGGDAAVDAAGLVLNRAAAATSVLFVIALGFMVFQPG